MTEFSLIYGPDPIFSKTCSRVDEIDADVIELCDHLVDLLYRENAVGVAAPMIGVLKRVIVVDLQESKISKPLEMINPSIAMQSDETQVFEEASICFPGISAKIERPKRIEVEYLDRSGKKILMDASGWLATVIQHEVDYLKGKTYFDYLSPIKRKMLLKKAKRQKLR